MVFFSLLIVHPKFPLECLHYHPVPAPNFLQDRIWMYFESEFGCADLSKSGCNHFLQSIDLHPFCLKSLKTLQHEELGQFDPDFLIPLEFQAGSHRHPTKSDHQKRTEISNQRRGFLLRTQPRSNCDPSNF